MCFKMIILENTYVFRFVMANWFKLNGVVFLQVQCYIKYWRMLNET
jgi:hypothetical protein